MFSDVTAATFYIFKSVFQNIKKQTYFQSLDVLLNATLLQIVFLSRIPEIDILKQEGLSITTTVCMENIH